jgi:histone-lysine N-methyltransferase SETMAR
MDKIEYRAAIKHLWKKGFKAKDIKTELDLVHGDSSPSVATIYNWIAEFKRGRTSIANERPPGRPISVCDAENQERVRKAVQNNRKLTSREIAEILSIPKSTVLLILRKHLGMKKINAKWVPHELTPQQKQVRVELSKRCLNRLASNPDDYWRRFVTVDETWVFHCTPGSPQSFRCWTAPGERPETRARLGKSTRKMLATVFWDQKGILLLDFLETGTTISGEYYSGLLEKLKDQILAHRPHLQKKKVLFHQDNAPPHKCRITTAKIEELGFEVVDHPPYSPDLAPSDYYLFSDLKRHLVKNPCESNEELKANVSGYFGGLPREYFSRGIRKLEQRWNKCILLGGEYTE